MKQEVIICDICGKPINYDEYRRFKIQMKKFHYACCPYDTNRWYKMDVHDECFKELCRLISLAKEERKKNVDKILKNINAFAELVNKS